MTNPANTADSEKAALIAELTQAGIKHTPENIVRIAKRSDGKIVFLELGNIKSGMQHILSKAAQFAEIGIDIDEIPDAVMTAIIEGEVVGTQGKLSETPRQIYKFVFKGEFKYMAITVSDNGYIVGANPRSRLR
ncbi:MULTISPECIES: hypothetical protein [Kamptonema]|uniref:hypothetical protein n=1 Tax=Kamptonema TaxID=1501433 RepID=UPI0001DAC75E|nr:MULTISPECIES: hypothetical protein [Kamptonema]CBN58574.1 conserved hypothetical protein [Kamptonema sp. PCC 6506]